MNAPPRFSHRHALNTVNARFKLQAGKHVAAGDGGAGFFDAANAVVVEIHHFELPTTVGGIAFVHAEQFGGEQASFIATGTCPDFQDGIFIILRVFGYS